MLHGTRWIAIAAGAFSGAAGSIEYGPLFLLVPSVLILGTIVQPWTARPGRWLMWLGAFFLTLYAGGFFVPQIVGVSSQLSSLDNLNIQILFCLILVAVFLVIWCDVALIVDARRPKGALKIGKQRFPRASDCIVWGAALCLTVITSWGVVASLFPYHQYGRWDILLLAITFGVAVLLLDVALLVHAVRQFRSSQILGGPHT